MFNRKDLPSIQNPFASRQEPQRPSPQGYANPNQGPPRYDYGHVPMPAGQIPDGDVPMTDANFPSSGYGAPSPQNMGRPQQPMPGRMPSASGQTWTLSPTKSPNDNYTFGNLYVDCELRGFWLASITNFAQCRCFTPGHSPKSRWHRCAPPHQ